LIDRRSIEHGGAHGKGSSASTQRVQVFVRGHAEREGGALGVIDQVHGRGRGRVCVCPRPCCIVARTVRGENEGESDRAWDCIKCLASVRIRCGLRTANVRNVEGSERFMHTDGEAWRKGFDRYLERKAESCIWILIGKRRDSRRWDAAFFDIENRSTLEVTERGGNRIR
jgi:hypothetical protein